MVARDWDYIRKILIDAENGEKYYSILSHETAKALGIDQMEFSIVSREQVKKNAHHIEILEQAELIKTYHFGSEGIFVESLTWAGHNFLDEIRDESNWKNTKAIAKKAGSTSMNAIVTIATSVTTAAVQKALGL